VDGGCVYLVRGSNILNVYLRKFYRLIKIFIV
jgi:hypothetical protein